MQHRTLENLILENEDYIFAGNLTITGEVQLTNSSLIVSGRLVLENGARIKGGDIICGYIDSDDISITDGDICINGDANFCDIKSDGNIEVGGDIEAGKIHCLNYLINGYNSSKSITSIQDIYILGSNNSYDIKGRDVFIGGYCDLYYHKLISECFECSNRIERCSSISVG